MSRIIMSFDSLVMMRPAGFESKNRIGDLVIFSIIVPCILFADVSVTWKKVTARSILEIRKDKINTPKTVG